MGRKKWLDSGSTVNIDCKGFPNRLDMGCEKKRDVKDESKIYKLND